MISASEFLQTNASGYPADTDALSEICGLVPPVVKS
jgi:hypothetical protein